MVGPGVPGSQVPGGTDALARRIGDIERQIRELGPSIAASFAPVVQTLQDQTAFLLDQTVEDERDPGTSLSYTATSDSDTGDVWWAVDAGDSSVSVTTSSTGRLRVDVSGEVGGFAGGYGVGWAYIGFEVLAGATQVLAPLAKHGTFVNVQGGGFASGTTTGPGDATSAGLYASGFDLITLSPNTTYTVRTRRGYRTKSTATAPGTAWNTAIMHANTTRIAVTKLGM